MVLSNKLLLIGIGVPTVAVSTLTAGLVVHFFAMPQNNTFNSSNVTNSSNFVYYNITTKSVRNSSLASIIVSTSTFYYDIQITTAIINTLTSSSASSFKSSITTNSTTSSSTPTTPTTPSNLTSKTISTNNPTTSTTTTTFITNTSTTTSTTTSKTTSNSLNKTITSTQTTPIYDILNTG